MNLIVHSCSICFHSSWSFISHFFSGKIPSHVYVFKAPQSELTVIPTMPPSISDKAKRLRPLALAQLRAGAVFSNRPGWNPFWVWIGVWWVNEVFFCCWDTLKILKRRRDMGNYYTDKKDLDRFWVKVLMDLLRLKFGKERWPPQKFSLVTDARGDAVAERAFCWVWYQLISNVYLYFLKLLLSYYHI